MAVLLALILAMPASADQIAYTCGGDICLINPDNPAEHSNLTETNAGGEESPVWSPDGSRIAYRGSYSPEWPDIYVLDPAEPAPREGTDVSQSPTRMESGEALSWSPDGSRIAYSSTALSSADPLQHGVYVVAAAGTSPPVPMGAGSYESNYSSWSPDGARIALNRPSEAVWIAAADGSGSPTFTGLGIYPSWSPDGKYIAGLRDNAYPYTVRINNADGSGFHDLTKPGDLATGFDWSPDSARITYVADGVMGPDNVWVAPADGSSPGVAIPMPPGWIVPHDPKFSPDGTRIAFDARPEAPPTYEQVLVAPADGSSVAVPITKSAEHNEQPDWKPGPVTLEPGGGGQGSSGGGGQSPPAGGAGQQPHPPVKVKLAYYRRPILAGGFMTPVGINCNAEGGHPTGKVAEICAASGNAYATAAAPQTARRAARPKTKRVLFAKGSVKVPEGETKPLKLKLTAAGKELLRPGKTLKLSLSITVKHGAGQPTKSRKTVKLSLPAKD